MLENETLTLECVLTDGNPRSADRYVFHHDSGQKQDSGSPDYLIPDIQKSQSSSYWCQADNGQGLDTGEVKTWMSSVSYFTKIITSINMMN